MKLYEIDAAILGCIDQETGEVIDPEQLDALQIERETKLENGPIRLTATAQRFIVS